MNLVFFSGHHRHTHEMAIRCHQAGMRLMLPPGETQGPFKHYAGKNLIPWLGLEKYHVGSYESLEELQAAVRRKEVKAFLISLPEHLTLLRDHFGDLPIAADHMVNDYQQYRDLGLRNFISPSRAALLKMNAPNQLHSIKVRDFSFVEGVVGKQILPTSQRRGFYSYIHRYQHRWKRAYQIYSEIERRLFGKIDIKNFGRESPNGEVDDLPTMWRSKGTIHIKDANVCCNAVLDSISVGTPVIIDNESLTRLGLEDYVVHLVSGVLFSTVDEGVDWIKRLDEDDELLGELSRRTCGFARLKLQNTRDDIVRFREFVERME